MDSLTEPGELDGGVSARAIRSMEDKDSDVEQEKIALEVATSLAKKLVGETQKMGLLAVHEQDPPIEGASEHFGASVDADPVAPRETRRMS